MRLLVTGARPGIKECVPKIEAFGHEVVFMQWEQDELLCPADWPEGLVCANLTVFHPIELFTNLRYILLTRTGFDHMDMDYIRGHGIEFHNAVGAFSIPMAEFAVGGVLQLYKQSRHFYDHQKQHIWERHRGLLELNGKTVCIVGCGDVGNECAKRFSAFGCSIVEVHRDLKNFDAIKSADIVVVTVALNEHTRHLVKPSEMKEGAVLVNISRGATVDQEDLIETLQSGKISAVLDVLEEEPPDESSPLWDMENVILTPHNSFIGDGNQERMMKIVLNNLEKVSC